MATVLTLGTFDPLHEGHLGLFRQCQNFAGEYGKLVVAVNSDQFIKQYRGALPSITALVRAEAINQLDMVDSVLINYGGANQAALINQVNPDFLVIGLDWAFKDYYGQLGITREWLEERNIQLAYVPRTGDWSSTEIKFRQ